MTLEEAIDAWTCRGPSSARRARGGSAHGRARGRARPLALATRVGCGRCPRRRRGRKPALAEGPIGAEAMELRRARCSATRQGPRSRGRRLTPECAPDRVRVLPSAPWETLLVGRARCRRWREAYFPELLAPSTTDTLRAGSADRSPRRARTAGGNDFVTAVRVTTRGTPKSQRNRNCAPSPHAAAGSLARAPDSFGTSGPCYSTLRTAAARSARRRASPIQKLRQAVEGAPEA